MCSICLMGAVKDHMLSRRAFFGRIGAVAGGAVLASTATAVPAKAAESSRVVDLTHTLHADFPTWEGRPLFEMEQVNSFDNDGFNLFAIRMYEHIGTHIDAPLHFSADGASVDTLPVENLVAPLCVIDIRARAAEDPDTELTPDDVRAWTAIHGPVPPNACVAMNSGWAAKVNSEAFRGFDGTSQHYPAFHVETAEMLLEETAASSIAVDTLSIDRGAAGFPATHVAWLPTGRFAIEAIANLDDVPPVGATVIIGAPKHAGGSGGPARILALV